MTGSGPVLYSKVCNELFLQNAVFACLGLAARLHETEVL
jgi:hypothetical protein